MRLFFIDSIIKLSNEKINKRDINWTYEWSMPMRSLCLGELSQFALKLLIIARIYLFLS